jgi:hypothetical protein
MLVLPSIFWREVGPFLRHTLEVNTLCTEGLQRNRRGSLFMTYLLPSLRQKFGVQPLRFWS